MAFRLALAFGCTIRELDARLDINELYEWEAFYALEPWGTHADDDRSRLIATLYAKVNFKNADEINWLDRDPEETERRKSMITMEEKMEAFFESLAAASEQ